MKLVRLYSPTGSPEHIRAALDTGEEVKVDTQLVADFGLYVGMELEEETLEEIRAAASRRRTRNRALRMVGARPMSAKELTEKLVRRGGTQEDAEETCQWLEDMGAVDDGEYARMIVRHYSARGYGMAKLKNELYRRGIGKDLWDEALAAAEDEEASIEALLDKRLRPGAAPEETRRTVDFLLRRGFGYEKIRAVMNRRGDMGDTEE